MKSKLVELREDEWVWVIFIILSIFNICGDELEKKFYMKNDNTSRELSKGIFTLTVLISFFLYIYLSYKKYKVLKYNRENNLRVDICEKRFIASILVVVASFLYLYCQVNDSDDINPSLV